MIVVRLKGGLGNQMFQYALGRVLALKNNDKLKLDVSFYESRTSAVARAFSLDIFNTKVEIATNSEIPCVFLFWRRTREKYFYFDKRILELQGMLYLDGDWQSPKYFEGFEEIIRQDFSLKNPPALNIQNLAKEIQNSESLCIHVRRGDYVGHKVHDVVNLEYYKNGVEHINQKTKIDKIYMFSDDIEWCRTNFSFEIPTEFVGQEYAGRKDEGHMYLMSQSKHFIIANSSFSWWGAWLSESKDKIVICPKQWFTNESINTSDLIPKAWIRI
jgi:hypothetical protein